MTPREIYKYRPIDEWTERLVARRELYFSPPSKFNDPFDCRVKVSSDGLGFHQDAIKRFYEFVQQTGVFCLSNLSPENVLMWSHYAEQHKGVCLKFDTTVGGEESIFNQKYLTPVEYSEETPVFAPGCDDLSGLARKSIFRKSLAWEYEEEWRLILANGATKTRTYPKGALTEITFGVNCTDEDMEKVIRWCQDLEPIPEFTKAVIKDGTYVIGFEPLHSTCC